MTCKAKTYGAEGSHPPEVISQDSEHRFVTDAQIEQWTNGTAGQGQYMAIMFRRSATVPDTPEGGSFSFPIPNGGQWTNTILPGIDPVFISTRFFTSDGKAPQQAVWSPPVLFVQHGSIGQTGPKGDQGTPGIQGPPGNDGINGADGVNGNDGVSIVWLGEASSHPIGAVNGNSYYNTTDKKTYIFQDDAWYQMTVDGVDGQEGISIVWQGGLTAPPANPETNWVYKNTIDGIIYIYKNAAWEIMVLDGNDGVNGADGADGLSVSIVYHDDPADGTPPTPPTAIDGISGGWYSAPTSSSNWMSQKVDQGTTNAWGIAIKIRGVDGTNGVDGADGLDGANGLSIVWKGDLANPPANPEINWCYRDTDNKRVYIYNGTAWELMTLDGNDGAAGANGADGLSVYITYHDADPTGIAPVPPTNVAGTDGGWHTDATSEVGWMSQKVDDGTGTGWGLAIPIRGVNGASGPRGSNTFTLDESDAGSYYITPAVAASWAGTLTNENAQAVARDIIGVPSGNGFSPDGYIRPNDKITVSDVSHQVVGTRIYLGIVTDDPTTILASHFRPLVTEVIDGSLLIKGTISADALGADIVSAGRIKSDLLLVTNAEISGQIRSDVETLTKDPMWELNKDGALIIRANDGSTILQSGGTIDKAFIDGLGDFAAINKITSANISTCMDAAVIAEAYLGTAAVGTLKIGENAVTVPVSVFTASSLTVPTGTRWATVQSVSINSDGQPISCVFSNTARFYVGDGAYQQGYTIRLRLKLNENIVIDSYIATSQLPYTKWTGGSEGSYSFIDSAASLVTPYFFTPSSGSQTLTLEVNGNYSGMSLFNRHVFALGVKR